MNLTHDFTSAADQNDDATLVRTADWNNTHSGDLVVPATGAGAIVIPGLEVADRVPASPNAKDDEFDGDLSAWTTLGSLDVLNTSDIPSHLHMKVNSSAYQLDGIYRAIPSMPFTVTVKWADYRHHAQYNLYHIVLGESDASHRWWTYGNAEVASYVLWTDWCTTHWSNRTTRDGVTDNNAGGYMQRYMRMTVASATNVTVQRSHAGLVWVTSGASINPSIGTPTVIGIAVTGYTSIPVEAAVDWIRFT